MAVRLRKDGEVDQRCNNDPNRRPENYPEEPGWAELTTNQKEQQYCRDQWRSITNVMHSFGTLTPDHGHIIKSLVLYRLQANECFKEIAENGGVTSKSCKHLQATLAKAVSQTTNLEDALNLTPRKMPKPKGKPGRKPGQSPAKAGFAPNEQEEPDADFEK